MSRTLLVYGATGYTAQLIIARAVARGIRPILCARNARQLESVAARWNLEYRVAELSSPDAMARALSGVGVVLNLAGPFAETVDAMIWACLAANAHYLDISGEVDALLRAQRYHSAARERGLMLMGGVGFDIVPSDCLCSYVVRRLKGARLLRVALSGLSLASRGSLKTLALELGRGTKVLRGGRLCEIEEGTLTRAFDFGTGERMCTAVSWGDLATAQLTSAAGDVETYFEATPGVVAVQHVKRFLALTPASNWMRAAMDGRANLLPSGPTAEARATAHASIVVEASDAQGRRFAARLRTPEAYTLTSETASRIADRVLAGDFEPGFQTPARLFGPDFILGFEGVVRTDLTANVEH